MQPSAQKSDLENLEAGRQRRMIVTSEMGGTHDSEAPSLRSTSGLTYSAVPTKERLGAVLDAFEPGMPSGGSDEAGTVSDCCVIDLLHEGRTWCRFSRQSRFNLSNDLAFDNGVHFGASEVGETAVEVGIE
jgi:hypothetical protein